MLELHFGPVLASLDQLLWASIASVVIGIAGMAVAMVVGTISALMSQVPARAARTTANLYVDLFRGTPILVQILFFYFLPAALGIDVSAYVTGIVALGLYYGSYISEIMRGAIEGVAVGQVDAARSLGMPKVMTFWRVQFPQAMTIVISPLAGQFSRLFKASSLLSVIGVSELTLRGQYVMTRTYAPIETWLVVAAIYFVFSSVAVYGSVWLEARLVRGRL